MTTKEILLKAVKILERGWVRGHLAINKNGQAVGPLNKAACQWCAEGAVIKAYGEVGPHRDAWNLFSAYTKEHFGVDGIDYNDQQYEVGPIIVALLETAKTIPY